MDLVQAADELYGLVPAEFTAARDERARRARDEGDKDLSDAIRKLRRPTVSASLVNRLVREAGDRVNRLLELGESLRDAQQSLAGDELRTLSARRRPMIQGLAQEAKRLAAQAGQPVSDQVGREVEATLEAALADPGAAGAVRSGRLTVALAYAGFGTVAVDAAVAIPVSRAPTAAPRADRREVTERAATPRAATQRAATQRAATQRAATQRAEEAAARERQRAEALAGELRDAEAMAADAALALDSATAQVGQARDTRLATQRRIEDLENQLELAHEQQAGAARTLREAQRRRDAAARAADEARRRLARAQSKLHDSR